MTNVFPGWFFEPTKAENCATNYARISNVIVAMWNKVVAKF